jgi:hypothetical protein
LQEFAPSRGTLNLKILRIKTLTSKKREFADKLKEHHRAIRNKKQKLILFQLDDPNEKVVDGALQPDTGSKIQFRSP